MTQANQAPTSVYANPAVMAVLEDAVPLLLVASLIGVIEGGIISMPDKVQDAFAAFTQALDEYADTLPCLVTEETPIAEVAECPPK